MSFIVTPIPAEANFMRDHDGDLKDAAEVERRLARMRTDFGMDVLLFSLRLRHRHLSTATGQARA